MGDRNTRYKTKGQVYIAEVSNTEALLKNLSSSGLCLHGPEFLQIMPKARYLVDIIPEKESNLDKFHLEIESRWVKAKMKSSESGFVIVIPPGGPGKTVFEKYLEFLSSQAAVKEPENDPS
jgi:hypothetical protein